MRAQASIDSYILLRYLLNDHSGHSPRAAALFRTIQLGEIAVFCPDTVVFESIHIMLRTMAIPRHAIADSLTQVLSTPGITLGSRTAILNALAFWVEQPALDFADCYHLALTAEMGLPQIYTFDKKMDRYPGVEWVEPA